MAKKKQYRTKWLLFSKSRNDFIERGSIVGPEVVPDELAAQFLEEGYIELYDGGPTVEESMPVEEDSSK
jgi:hypothetical protein